MTVNGWIQIAIYFVVLTALVVPLGRFMARVFEGERTFLSPVLASRRGRSVPHRRRRRDARAALARLYVRDAAVQCCRVPGGIRLAAAATPPAAQSRRHVRGGAGSVPSIPP